MEWLDGKRQTYSVQKVQLCVAADKTSSSLVSHFNPQWHAGRNTVCLGDPRPCSKNKWRFLNPSMYNLQLSIAADMWWWSLCFWDPFPGAGVECRGQQGRCSCKCQQIILLLSPRWNGQSCVPSSPGAILETKLQIPSWDFLWYLLWDLVGWNFQVRQTFAKNVGSGPLAWETVRNILPWLMTALPPLLPCSLSHVTSRSCCHKLVGSELGHLKTTWHQQQKPRSFQTSGNLG